MKKLALLICGFLSMASVAQIPQMNWQHTAQTDNFDIPIAIQAVADGGAMVAGYKGNGFLDTEDGQVVQTDGYLIKCGINGNMEWEWISNMPFQDRLVATRQTPDGGCIAVGAYDFPYISGNGTDGLLHVAALAGGHFAAAGYSTSADGDISDNHLSGTGMPTEDFWVMKINASGNLLENQSFGGSARDFFRGFDVEDNGNYYLCGWTDSNDGDVETDLTGRKRWVFKLGGQAFGMPKYYSTAGVATYPNPTSGMLRLVLPGGLSADYMRVCDYSGRNISIQSVNLPLIDVGHLSSGIYFTEISAGQQTFKTKFIKQ